MCELNTLHWLSDLKCSFNGTSFVPLRGPCLGPKESLSQLGHQGRTPVFMAAYHGHREVARQLIAAGPLGGGLEDLPSEGRKGSHCRDPLRGRRVFGKGGTL